EVAHELLVHFRVLAQHDLALVEEGVADGAAHRVAVGVAGGDADRPAHARLGGVRGGEQVRDELALRRVGASRRGRRGDEPRENEADDHRDVQSARREHGRRPMLWPWRTRATGSYRIPPDGPAY